MSWVWKPGALRKARDARGVSVKRLAIEAGLSEKQIRRIEAAEVREGNDETIYGLQRVLNLKSPEELAWRSEEDAARAQAQAQAREQVRRSSRVRTAERTRLAQREVKLGLDQQMVRLGAKRYPVVGFNRLIECDIRYAELQETFLVQGTVRDYRVMTPDAAAMLGAEPGRGAAYFRIQRDVDGLGDDGGPVPLDVTVFAPQGTHGRALHACMTNGAHVDVLAEIIVRGPGDEHRGFPRIDDSGELSPWAFVATSVVVK
jgi:transcriptional regulator with XRE-family HTH domain